MRLLPIFRDLGFWRSWRYICLRATGAALRRGSGRRLQAQFLVFRSLTVSGSSLLFALVFQGPLSLHQFLHLCSSLSFISLLSAASYSSDTKTCLLPDCSTFLHASAASLASAQISGVPRAVLTSTDACFAVNGSILRVGALRPPNFRADPVLPSQ